MIEQLVAGTLMAEVRLDMPPSGLTWRLDAPLANLAPETAA